jgi:hypothetical protein
MPKSRKFCVAILGKEFVYREDNRLMQFFDEATDVPAILSKIIARCGKHS